MERIAKQSLTEAYAYCRRITVEHYENFPVASLLLPRDLRQHIYPIYAFARHADDLADESRNEDALLKWREALHRSFEDPPEHPILLALRDTVEKFQIPSQWFDDLLSAFLLDLQKNRFEDWDELLAYCRLSANPVGRILLHMVGVRDEGIYQLSDAICTALQLTNFWQDVSIDLQKNRIYIPREFMNKYGYAEADLYAGKENRAFRAMMQELCAHTRELFKKGTALLQYLRGRFRWEIQLTVRGGMHILQKIQKMDYRVLSHRPVLSRWDWIRLILLPTKMNGSLNGITAQQ